MKIVAILGSPHGARGNTAKLLAALMAASEDAGATVKTIDLAKYKIGFCRACDGCHRNGVCPVKDDFAMVKRAMEKADGIVLASPNYIWNVSGQIKALLDRCCGPLHCQSMRGKYGAAVVTSGGAGGEDVERYLLRFLRNFGCWSVGSVGGLSYQLQNAAESRPALHAAAELGRRLVQCIRDQETFVEQEQERTAFYERMQKLVSMNKDKWAYEREYWTAHNRGVCS